MLSLLLLAAGCSGDETEQPDARATDEPDGDAEGLDSTDGPAIVVGYEWVVEITYAAENPAEAVSYAISGQRDLAGDRTVVTTDADAYFAAVADVGSVSPEDVEGLPPELSVRFEGTQPVAIRGLHPLWLAQLDDEIELDPATFDGSAWYGFDGRLAPLAAGDVAWLDDLQKGRQAVTAALGGEQPFPLGTDPATGLRVWQFTLARSDLADAARDRPGSVAGVLFSLDLDPLTVTLMTDAADAVVGLEVRGPAPDPFSEADPEAQIEIEVDIEVRPLGSPVAFSGGAVADLPEIVDEPLRIPIELPDVERPADEGEDPAPADAGVAGAPDPAGPDGEPDHDEPGAELEGEADVEVVAGPDPDPGGEVQVVEPGVAVEVPIATPQTPNADHGEGNVAEVVPGGTVEVEIDFDVDARIAPEDGFR